MANRDRQPLMVAVLHPPQPGAGDGAPPSAKALRCPRLPAAWLPHPGAYAPYHRKETCVASVSDTLKAMTSSLTGGLARRPFAVDAVAAASSKIGRAHV